MCVWLYAMCARAYVLVDMCPIRYIFISVVNNFPIHLTSWCDVTAFLMNDVMRYVEGQLVWVSRQPCFHFGRL